MRVADTLREQARESDGRFGVQPHSAPEARLRAAEAPGGEAASEAQLTEAPTVGCRVSYKGGPAHRVASISGPTLILRNLAGSTVVATADEVSVIPETEAERESNTRVERTLGGIRATLRSASRQQKQRLDELQGDRLDVERAVDRVNRAVMDGYADRELTRMADALCREQPLGARLAIMAVACREHLSAIEYQSLTQTYVRAVGPIA